MKLLETNIMNRIEQFQPILPAGQFVPLVIFCVVDSS